MSLQHLFSNSLGLADALLAATTMIHGLPLLAAKAKHDRVLKPGVPKVPSIVCRFQEV